MRYRFLKFTFPVLLVPLLLSCAKSNEKGAGGFKIILEDKETSSPLHSLLDWKESLVALTNPSTLADFNCFAVNVTGGGVPPDAKMQGCTSTTNFQGRGIGAFSSPVPRGATIELSIPSGPGRNIDVYGVYPPVPECTGTQNAGSSQGYFLGAKNVDVAEDMIVTVPISYSGAAGEITCNNGNSPQSYLPNGTYGGVRANPISGGACTLTDASAPAMSLISNAFEISSPNRDAVFTTNATYLSRDCTSAGTDNILPVEFYFYLNPTQASQYSSIEFTWTGHAGIKTGCTGSVVVGTGSTHSMRVAVYKYSTTSWINLQTIGITDGTYYATISNPSAYVVTSGAETGTLVFRVTGGSANSSDCSVVNTDFAQARFIP